MKRHFFGGVHPDGRKDLSISAAPPRAVSPKIAVLPMQQHIGAPCQPLVQRGDRVLRGQKIGDGEGLCVPVHASVSGRVIAVEPRPHPSGQEALAVVIENDFLDSAAPCQANPLPAGEIGAEEMLRAIREAGIVGMGGAAFPGDVKALGALGRIDCLIANACECEPYITADDCLLRFHPEQVLQGMALLKQLLRPERAVLAVEDNKIEAIARLQPLLQGTDAPELAILPARYPQGSEKQLILAVTGQELAPGGLPADAGCAVFNVSTFAAIYRAVRLGLPVTRRIVTVSGEAVAQPQNFLARIGTPFSELIARAGGLTAENARVISGGPMMGRLQAEPSVPVVKAVNCVLCLPEEKMRADGRVCLRCGKCVEVCPMHLLPLEFYRREETSNLFALQDMHIFDCIECGCCAYICPGMLPLVERIRRGKHALEEGSPK